MNTPEQEFSRIEIYAGNIFGDFQGLELQIPSQILPQFKELVSRALNVWPDCHPALKEFGDILTHGKVLQDNYWAQRTDIKKKKV